jgi:DNA-directed RNA polymerase sigma subunit (sigma70/sigma32)
MKTTFKRTYRAGIKQHKWPRIRLTPSRRSSQFHTAALPIATVPTKSLPTTVSAETETIPTESLQGDTFQLYLREIGRVKLLTPQEEITLARRIRRGDKKAREQMITANLRLVVKIARDYEGHGLPLLDLINEGNIGLMKASIRAREQSFQHMRPCG